MMKYKYEIFSCGELVAVNGDYMGISDSLLYIYHGDPECKTSSGLKIQAIFKQWEYIVSYEE